MSVRIQYSQLRQDNVSAASAIYNIKCMKNKNNNNNTILKISQKVEPRRLSTPAPGLPRNRCRTTVRRSERNFMDASVGCSRSLGDLRFSRIIFFCKLNSAKTLSVYRRFEVTIFRFHRALPTTMLDNMSYKRILEYLKYPGHFNWPRTVRACLIICQVFWRL